MLVMLKWPGEGCSCFEGEIMRAKSLLSQPVSQRVFLPPCGRVEMEMESRTTYKTMDSMISLNDV